MQISYMAANGRTYTQAVATAVLMLANADSLQQKAPNFYIGA